MQLLLVDDERSVVEALAETIPWESCGISTVHEATSGAMALEMLENHPIDIVITDIRMPGMSGIELIAVIRSRWPLVNTMLLSGHADFAYAQQAILQGSFDYLLKPVRDEDLIQAVTRLVQHIRTKWEEAASYQKALYSFRENKPLLRSTLLNELITGRVFPESKLADKLNLLELPFSAGDEFGMLIIRMEQHLSEMGDRDLALMEYAICNIVSEVMQEHFYIWHARDDHDYIVILLRSRPGSAVKPAKPADLLEAYAAKIQTQVQLYLKGAISVLVSSGGTFPDQIRETYEHAVLSMRKQMGQGQGLFVSTSFEPLTKPVHTIRSLYEPPGMISLLEAARFEDVGRKIDQTFGELLQSAEEHDVAEHLVEAYHALAGAFAYIIHKNGKPLANVMPEDAFRQFSAPSFTTVRQLHEWSLRILNCIREDAEQELKDNHSAIVRSANSYIVRHLAGDVSLPAIAREVHLHPVYLSKVYKAETGETLTAYVYRLRMEKAAFYLSTTNAKVFEISEMVGYNNTAYFIRVFKKYYDVTPQEYRERLLQ